MPEPLLNAGYSDPRKSEKINGLIYNMAAGTYRHADAISALNDILFAYFHKKKCRVYSSELEIHLDENNEYRPDISVICDFTKMRDNGYYGPPALVIEVLSPSTAKRDRGEKFGVYRDNGVNELWFVSPEYETIEQFSLVNGTYGPSMIHFKSGAAFYSTVFEDLEVSIDEIFTSR